MRSFSIMNIVATARQFYLIKYTLAHMNSNHGSGPALVSNLVVINPCSAGMDYRRHNLTSVDVRL